MTANIVHISVLTHIAACFCFSVWCLRLSTSVLRWKSIKMCGRLLAPLSGVALTTRATHSLHCTLPNNSMMTRSLRLCIHWSPPKRLTGPRPQALRSVHSETTRPHQLTCSCGPHSQRHGEASLAEAVTQLSFLEFLQRCNLLIAPLQPPQLPVPISPLDAAVQTTSPCDASQDVSTQTSDQQVSPIFFDVAVQTSSHGIHISSLDAAVQTTPHSTLSQHVSTQMGSRSASSLSVDVFVQTPTRNTVLHDVSTQLPLTEFFIGCIFSNDPLDRQNFNRQRPSLVQDDIGRLVIGTKLYR